MAQTQKITHKHGPNQSYVDNETTERWALVALLAGYLPPDKISGPQSFGCAHLRALYEAWAEQDLNFTNDQLAEMSPHLFGFGLAAAEVMEDDDKEEMSVAYGAFDMKGDRVDLNGDLYPHEAVEKAGKHHYVKLFNTAPPQDDEQFTENLHALVEDSKKECDLPDDVLDNDDFGEDALSKKLLFPSPSVEAASQLLVAWHDDSDCDGFATTLWAVRNILGLSLAKMGEKMGVGGYQETEMEDGDTLTPTMLRAMVNVALNVPADEDAMLSHVRIVRYLRDMTQRELGERLGVSASAISEIERGIEGSRMTNKRGNMLMTVLCKDDQAVSNYKACLQNLQILGLDGYLDAPVDRFMRVSPRRIDVGVNESGKALPQIVRSIRKCMDMSQVELGEEIGKSGPIISRIETGHRMFDPELAGRLVKALQRLEEEGAFESSDKEIETPDNPTVANIVNRLEENADKHGGQLTHDELRSWVRKHKKRVDIQVDDEDSLKSPIPRPRHVPMRLAAAGLSAGDLSDEQQEKLKELVKDSREKVGNSCSMRCDGREAL